MGTIRKSFILVVVFLSLGCGLALAQETPPTPENPLLKPVSQWQYSDTFVYLRQGGIMAGMLLGLENQAVVLSVPQGRRAIPLADIARVVIKPEKKGNANFVFGMLLGIYARNLLYGHAEGKPFGYMGRIGSPLGFALSNSFFAAVGGAIVVLIDPLGEANEQRFDFSEAGLERQAQWERLRQCLSGVPSEPKVHLTVMGGAIMAGSIGRYNRSLESAGYVLGSYYPQYDQGQSYDVSSGNFTMFRKIQLTLNLGHAFEVGLAYCPLAEPTAIAGKYQQTYMGDQEIDTNFHTIQTLAASGFYAVAVYKPFSGRLPKPFSWSIGLGLGAARVNYHLNNSMATEVLHNGYYVSYQNQEGGFGYSRTRPSGVVYTQFECFLYRSLSLGLIADFVYVPSVRVPAFPEMGLSAQSLRFGNASVGFVLGAHF
jgi:hypothetical protein